LIIPLFIPVNIQTAVAIKEEAITQAGDFRQLKLKLTHPTQYNNNLTLIQRSLGYSDLKGIDFNYCH
jgi:hypothetical protein